MKRPRVVILATASIVVLLSALPLAATATSNREAARSKCVVASGSGDAAFVRNFKPFNVGSTRDFTWGGIYEQLVISTAFGGGNVYNVLAKKLEFSKNGKTLTITIVPNAKWSDGKPVTARDVLYSLTIGRQDKTADRIGLVSPNSNIESVKLAGKNKVAIRFKQIDSTFIGASLARVPVVPQHIWSKVKDTFNFTNPNPVGSGPFNRITRFNGQSYVLSKNPNYWLKGKPQAPCIERIFAASNDASLLQIVNGDADWTHNFYPNVEQVYQAKDPKNYHNAYLTTALPIGLFFDLTKYPYSLNAFRRGVSRAIDRKTVSKLGEYGYAPPTDALGIGNMYPKWIDPSLKARARTMAAYDPAVARKIFTDAGFTYKGGDLVDPKGDKVSFQVHVIGGWSDWVASLQIITRNLREVGIDASVKLEPDWGAWQPNAMSTKFTTLLWNYGAEDLTPYRYFFSHFDPTANLGAGVDASATGNWEHYQNAPGANLLRQFKGTLDPKKQLQISYQLQKIFLDELPYVPLFIGPRWSTYSTKYFKGWVTWKNQYVDPIFTTNEQVWKILVSLYPVKAT
jgi:peptide/nickel transport system substrate-binding protein